MVGFLDGLERINGISIHFNGEYRFGIQKIKLTTVACEQIKLLNQGTTRHAMILLKFASDPRSTLGLLGHETKSCVGCCCLCSHTHSHRHWREIGSHCMLVKTELEDGLEHDQLYYPWGGGVCVCISDKHSLYRSRESERVREWVSEWVRGLSHHDRNWKHSDQKWTSCIRSKVVMKPHQVLGFYAIFWLCVVVVVVMTSAHKAQLRRVCGDKPKSWPQLAPPAL